METSRILIVGAGELGQALGDYLHKKGNDVIFWDIDRAKSSDSRPLHEIIPFVDFALLCVPSWAVRSMLSEATSVLRLTTIVVALSKGMDASLGYTMAELLPELLPKHQQFVVVGGPMLAPEIVAGKNAAAVFASPFGAAAKKVADLFASPVFTVEVSNDALGVSLGGVLKNIYAIGLGIADGLELGDNAKGFIAARAIDEMIDIAEALRVGQSSILGTAGLADFIATSYSPYSRNRAVGDEIVKTGTCGLKGEGFVSIPPLMTRLGADVARFPLLNAIKKIAIDCEPARPIMDALLTDK